jgi:hypothetical protein
MPYVNNDGPDTSCTEFTHSSSYDLTSNLAAFRHISCLKHRWSFHTNSRYNYWNLCLSHQILPLLALQFFVRFGLLNSSLPCFFIHSHFTPILNLYFSQIRLTLPSYLNLGLPTLLPAFGLPSVILFTSLSLSILTICPIHHILCAVIYLTISACLISKSISLKALILKHPYDFLFGHIFSSLLSFQTLLIVLQLSS